MALSASDLQKILDQQQKQFESLLKGLSVSPKTSFTTSLPKFDAYIKNKEKFEQYVERLEQHFILHNAVNDEPKKACLLASIGPETYSLLKNIFAGVDLSKKKYNDLVSELTRHFKESVNKFAARHVFNQSNLKPGQSYADWAVELRGLASDCDFTCESKSCSATFIDSMIIDVIIRRTPHAEVRRRCLQDSKLTLQTLIDMADNYVNVCQADRTVQGERETQNEDISLLSGSYKTKFNKRNNPKSQRNYSTQANVLKGCPSCFSLHPRSECPAKSQTCRRCSKIGHFASVCRTDLKKMGTNLSSHCVTEMENDEIEQVEFINSLQYERKQNRIFIPLNVNGVHVDFQWDSGATCSIIGNDTHRLIGSPLIHPVSSILRTCGGHELPVKGKCNVTVSLGSKTIQNLSLLVIDSHKCANLMGIPWSDEFGLTEGGMAALHQYANDACLEPIGEHMSVQTPRFESYDVDKKLEEIKQKHPSVFATGIGRCEKTKAHIQIKQNEKPVFKKARTVPFSQMKPFKTELDRLVEQGVLEKIEYSDWAVPTVAVTKPNGKLRLCGDFVEVNQRSETQQHPIPHIDEIMSKLRGGQRWTTLDMSDAYFHLELDEESKKVCVINTIFGLYRYNRLPFGVSSAPAIFQSIIDKMVSSLNGVASYLDDIIVTGSNDKEHWENFEKVVAAMEEFGFRVKTEKCTWFAEKCTYLGFEISADGRRPAPTAVNAIQNLPRPKSVDEVQAFLGKVGYYASFIPNLSSKAAPLNALRRKGTEFSWTDDCENAFFDIKKTLIKETCLTHFNPKKELILATDASPYGIGVVLSQVEEGVEKPIAFGSKSLTVAQRNYSQLDKEGLAVIFGVTKFHKYLYGRRFTLQLDNKPLSYIFSPTKEIPLMASQRMIRWILKLRAYDFKITLRSTSQHANADCLSRLPAGEDRLFDSMEENDDEEAAHQIEAQIFNAPFDADTVAKETNSDSTLSTVKNFITENKWPVRLSPETEYVRSYWQQRNRLFIHENILMLACESENRCIIPESMRNGILEILHTAHFGVVRMKQTARRYVWWPNISRDIEMFCKRCDSCRKSASNPKQTYSSWPEPQEPWHRIHVDYAGPFFGKMWLVVIDSKSKFPYIGMLDIKQTTSENTVEVLKQIFSIEGLCDVIVSDNGAQFTSKIFEDFCESLGIKHITSPSYHPASNGEAERFVSTFKSHMLKLRREDTNWNENINENIDKNKLWGMAREVLFTYRTMSHPELNGESPAEVLHGRQPKNLLTLLKRISSRQCRQSEKKNSRKKQGTKELFPVNSLVYARNYRHGPKWIPGKVIRSVGFNVRIVECARGVWKRHCNQLQVRLADRDETARSRTSEDPGPIENWRPETTGGNQGPPEPTRADRGPEASRSETGERMPRTEDRPTRGTQRETNGRYPNRNRTRTEKYGFDPL